MYTGIGGGLGDGGAEVGRKGATVGEAAEWKAVWVYGRDDVTRMMESFTYGHVMLAVS